MIAGHLSIPDNTIIAGGDARDLHSIKAPGVYTGAFPALPHREWKQVASHVRRLRALADRVAALERALRAQAAGKEEMPMTLIELEASWSRPAASLSRRCSSTGCSSASRGSPRAA